MTQRSPQQIVTYVGNFDPDNLADHGFTTDEQRRAIVAVSDLCSTVKEQRGQFGMMLFLIADEDLLHHRPVTVWSNLDDKNKLAILEDYVLARIKNRADA